MGEQWQKGGDSGVYSRVVVEGVNDSVDRKKNTWHNEKKKKEWYLLSLSNPYFHFFK